MTEDSLPVRVKNWISTHTSSSMYFNLAAISSEKRARLVTYGIDDIEKYKESGKRTAEFLQQYYNPDSVVMDIGCGIGRVAKFIAPNVRSLYCVDVSNVMLKRARKFVGSLPNVTFYRTKGNELKGIESNSVTFAYSFDMFPHISDEATYLYLKELRRVLQPDGRIYLQFANLLHPENEASFKDEAKFFLNTTTKTRYITPQQLEEITRLSGLKFREIVPGRNMILIADKK